MSFTRTDYHAIFAFAREQYFWHESTGRGYDDKAILVMLHVEDVIGQQSSFPEEARRRAAEIPAWRMRKIWRELEEACY